MTSTLIEAEYGSEAWQQERRAYIGASDVPAILGMSPYGSAYDVWLAKKHGVQQEANFAMEMGHLLEPVVAELYRRRFPNAVLEPCGTVAHQYFPWLRATIDRKVTTEHGTFPLEIKSTSQYMAGEWGDEGTDQVPDHVTIQIQSQMLVSGDSKAHAAVLIGGNDFRAPYVIEADREVQEMIVEGCKDFYTRFVIGDEEPEITGPNTEKHLKRKYASHNDQMVTATEVVDQIVSEYARCKADLAVLEEKASTLKTSLMSFIGANKGLVSRNGRITWSESRGRESFDHKALIAHLNVPSDVVQSFTRAGAPYRTFRYTAPKS